MGSCLTKNEKIFIAGSRAISFLPKEVEDRLHGIYKKGFSVIVGDASGVDAAVQRYFYKLGYRNITVYASNGRARNNFGNWQVESVSVPPSISDFDFYVMKDKAMAAAADYGFMIWDHKSRGTICNILCLLNANKRILLYSTPRNAFLRINDFEKLEDLLRYCEGSVKALYRRLKAKSRKENNLCLSKTM